MESVKHYVLCLGRFIVLVVKRYREDRCGRVAGALSYTTLLALVPLSAVLLAVLSIFPGFRNWINTVQEFIYSNFVPASGKVVQQYLNSFAENTAGLTIWGSVFLVVATLFMMSSIEQTFNDIWHVTRKRRTLYRFVSYWALLTLVPLLIGGSFSISSYLIAETMTLGASGGFFANTYTSSLKLLPVMLEVVIFMLLYTVVPNINVKWRHALLAAMFSLFMFELAKQGFAYFIVHFSAYKKIYGAIAALPIFLVWLYISWVIILMGAVLTASLPDWTGLVKARDDQPETD
ncbi:MAG TPA: YihY family inner membrane protein [Acidiferrobacteraceae bacterium]|nr:YihY family inner membrane protein [Acidiferrobacteraceae bacterium]HEX20310.1 YihY family inner membrane protein [Acidiferrobacteraceae bacterium]